VWLLLSDEPVFGLEKVVVGGSTRLSADEAMALAGLSRGMNLLHLDLGRASAALERLPFVRQAKVVRELPDTVRVEIEERRPAILVALGPLYVADEEGVLYRRLRPDERPALPLLTGLPRDGARLRPALVAERIRDALALARALGRRCFEEISWHEIQGMSVLLCDGPEARVGRPPFEPKVARLWKALRRAPRARAIFVDDERRPERAVVRMPPRGG
jgi:cell division septal protein FtsQ